MTNTFVGKTLLALLLPFLCAGQCAAADNFLTSLFKTGDGAVAVKVATLSESMGIHGLDFSPDGKHLAVTSTSDSDEVHAWDWQGSKSILLKMKKGGGSAGAAPEPLRYSPDGRYLAACHGAAEKNSVIHIWDASSGAPVHYVEVPRAGACSSIGFTPDGQWLVRVGDRRDKFSDGIVVYRTTGWQPVWNLNTYPFHPVTLAISPDGKYAAIGGDEIIPIQLGGRIEPIPAGQRIPIRQQIRIVDLSKREVIRTIDDTVLTQFGQIAWHPDGKSIAAIGRQKRNGGTDGGGSDTVMVFDAESGKQLAGEQFGGGGYMSIRYSPDGKYLIEADMNGLETGAGVRIWDGQHRTLLQEIRGNVSSLAVSPDGHYFAMGEGMKIVVWKLK